MSDLDNSLGYSFKLLFNDGAGKVITKWVTFTPNVDEDGLLTWTNNGGLPNPNPVNIKGPEGESPKIQLLETEDGVKVIITSSTGTQESMIYNGAQGFSPIVTFADIEGGVRLSIQDVDGVKSADIMDGNITIPDAKVDDFVCVAGVDSNNFSTSYKTVTISIAERSEF